MGHPVVNGWTKDKDKAEIPERKRILKALESWDTESDPSEKSYMLGMKALARSFTNIENFISEKEPLAATLIEMWRALKASNTAIGTVKTRTATRTVTIAQGQAECSTATERATLLRAAVNNFFKKLPEPADANTLKLLMGGRMGTEDWDTLEPLLTAGDYRKTAVFCSTLEDVTVKEIEDLITAMTECIVAYIDGTSAKADAEAKNTRVVASLNVELGNIRRDMFPRD